jgi:hypothetical protein
MILYGAGENLGNWVFPLSLKEGGAWPKYRLQASVPQSPQPLHEIEWDFQRGASGIFP